MEWVNYHNLDESERMMEWLGVDLNMRWWGDDDNSVTKGREVIEDEGRKAYFFISWSYRRSIPTTAIQQLNQSHFSNKSKAIKKFNKRKTSSPWPKTIWLDLWILSPLGYWPIRLRLGNMGSLSREAREPWARIWSPRSFSYTFYIASSPPSSTPRCHQKGERKERYDPPIMIPTRRRGGDLEEREKANFANWSFSSLHLSV